MATTALEQSIIDLCDQHSLTSITIGMNLKQREQFRFDVTAHWDGYSTRGIGCTSEYGPTLSVALRATLARAIAERTPVVTAELADEPLQVELAA